MTPTTTQDEAVDDRADDRPERRRSPWHHAFASPAVGALVVDADGVVVDVNAAGAALLRRAYGDIVGRARTSLLEAVPDGGVALPSVRPAEGVLTARTTFADGETRWFRLASAAATGADEAGTQHVLFSDITDLYRAEERAAVFESLVRSSPDFIAITDRDGRLTFLNDAGRRMAGIPDDVDVRTLRAEQLWPVTSETDGAAADLAKDDAWPGLSSVRCWQSGDTIPVVATTFAIPDLVTGDPVAVATKRRDVRAQLADRRRLEALSEQRRALLQDLLHTEHDERRRLAEDIHDEPVQLLAAASLRLQLLDRQVRGRDADGSVDSLVHVTELVDAAVLSLRRIMFEFDPAENPAADVAALLLRTAQMLFSGSGTTVRVDGQIADLPEDVAAALQRSAREALSNARKHARAELVTVRLLDTPQDATVVVEDDGIGIGDDAVTRAGHLGLRVMRNRLEALGGSVSVLARDEGGTRVTLSVPRAGAVVGSADRRSVMRAHEG